MNIVIYDAKEPVDCWLSSIDNHYGVYNIDITFVKYYYWFTSLLLLFAKVEPTMTYHNFTSDSHFLFH